MTTNITAQAHPQPPRATPERNLGGFAIIGVSLAVMVAAFAYLGGWFTPNALTPTRMTDTLEQVDGVHSGYRRNHARGLSVSGYFDSNGNGARLSSASVFRQGQIPVIGRFSLGGGNPDAADTPGDVRGLGLQFSPPDGEIWRTAMINLPVFPFRTPEAFRENLLTSKPDPQTGKPDAARRKEFLDRHPETVRVLNGLRDLPISSGFDNTAFYGLNAFRFVNFAGKEVPVRWLVKPEQPFLANSGEHGDKKYLFDDLAARLKSGSLRWRLLLTVGQPGDPTNDATQAWPEDREKVDAGIVTIERAEENGEAESVTFDPLVLPAGIVPSDDPLLSARSAIYSQAFTRRAGETKHPGE
jgi:catalase